MKITVVAPVLNAEQFIEDSLQSITSQTHQDWEYIAVDGGSTDKTVFIVEEIARSDPRIRVVSFPGSGIYDAIFRGFEEAQGDVLCWLNADDEYMPWTFSMVLNKLEDSTVNWVTGFPGSWDVEGNLLFVRSYGWYPQNFIRRGFFHGDFLGFLQAESMFFRKSAFEGLSDEAKWSVLSTELAGDYYFWRALSENNKLRVIPALLGGFRTHGGNRSIISRDEYMQEVYEGDVIKLNPRLGRHIGRLFQIVSTGLSFFTVQKADRKQQEDAGLL